MTSGNVSYRVAQLIYEMLLTARGHFTPDVLADKIAKGLQSNEWLADPALVDYAGDQANARRALQARIDAALEVIDLSEGFGGEPTLAEVRTTLLGEATSD